MAPANASVSSSSAAMNRPRGRGERDSALMERSRNAPEFGEFQGNPGASRRARADCSLTPLPRRLHLRGRNSSYLLTALQVAAEVSTAHFARPVSPGAIPPRVWLFRPRATPAILHEMAFSLTSPAFTDGSPVPAQYTCDGAD